MVDLDVEGGEVLRHVAVVHIFEPVLSFLLNFGAILVRVGRGVHSSLGSSWGKRAGTGGWFRLFGWLSFS